jgi:hypothetical protein
MIDPKYGRIVKQIAASDPLSGKIVPLIMGYWSYHCNVEQYVIAILPLSHYSVKKKITRGKK